MATMVDAKPRDLWWFRKNVPCLDACPVKTDAGRYVQLIAEGRFAEAYRVARDPNPIASICGRGCGAPCEDACRRGKIDAPVTIRALKRFLTDQFGPESLSTATLKQVLTGSMGGGSVTPLHADQILQRGNRGKDAPRVAVVGAGPAGMACAHDLALMGYRVTLFEAMPAPGGMMRYGIPAYRLAREVIDRQAAEIESMGVEFRYNTPLTATFGVRELLADGFGAIFIAVGASRGRSVPIENADADGVIKAIDYLLNINRGYRVPLGRKVVVVGGGLVAIDAARTAVRAMVPGLSISTADEEAVEGSTMRVALDVAREAARRGALEVDVVSLESEREMPAMKSEQGREELEVAREEAVSFIPSWGPKRIIVREGKAVGIELVRCVRVFDDTGRFKPEFDESQRRTIDADTIILAIGQAPDLSFLKPEDGVETTPGGIAQDRSGDARDQHSWRVRRRRCGFSALACSSPARSRASSPRARSTPICMAKPSRRARCGSSSRRFRPTPTRWFRSMSRSIDIFRSFRSSGAAESPRSSPRCPVRKQRNRPAAASIATCIRFTTARAASCAIDASISVPNIACISRPPIESPTRCR